MMKRKRNYLILFISGWIYFVATRDRMPIRSDLIHLSSITRCLCPILLQAPILYLCRLIYPFHSPRLLIFRCHRCQLLGHLLRSRWFPTFPDQASHWKICFDLLAWRMMSRIGNQIFRSHLMFPLVFDSVVPPSNSFRSQRIRKFQFYSFQYVCQTLHVQRCCLYRTIRANCCQQWVMLPSLWQAVSRSGLRFFNMLDPWYWSKSTNFSKMPLMSKKRQWLCH